MNRHGRRNGVHLHPLGLKIMTSETPLNLSKTSKNPKKTSKFCLWRTKHDDIGGRYWYSCSCTVLCTQTRFANAPLLEILCVHAFRNAYVQHCAPLGNHPGGAHDLQFTKNTQNQAVCCLLRQSSTVHKLYYNNDYCNRYDILQQCQSKATHPTNLTKLHYPPKNNFEKLWISFYRYGKIEVLSAAIS